MKYIQGDIIDAFETGEFDMILHQCNCFGIGAGIAKILDDRYDLSDIYRSSPEFNLGTIKWTRTRFGFIGNMFSQFKPGGCRITGVDSFEFRTFALKQCLKIIGHGYSYNKIAIPLIASGLAADQFKKLEMSDLEYFKAFIAPTVEKYLPNVTVYYL